MQKLQHPNVIRLEDVFETPRTMMLVLEYARGTELFDSILQVWHGTREGGAYTSSSSCILRHTYLTVHLSAESLPCAEKEVPRIGGEAHF